MKTTIDIHDELLARAEQCARNTGRPLHAVIEEACTERPFPVAATPA